MFKLVCYRNNELQEYRYFDVYDVEQNSSYERIIMGLTQGHINAILDFIAVLNGSFYMLYILHTPRADNESGRYQSKKLSYDEISVLFNNFRDFFENDSRHDIWVHSPETDTTIVYDRHNLIYLYGFNDKHIQILKKKELKKETVNIPSPHVHSYNAEYDTFESKIINDYQWRRTPLEDEDRQ